MICHDQSIIICHSCFASFLEEEKDSLYSQSTQSNLCFWFFAQNLALVFNNIFNVIFHSQMLLNGA